MDTRTGIIYITEEEAQAAGVPPEFLKRLEQAKSELTTRQQVTHQTLAYEPCPCGSGAKFKFCCYAKTQQETNLRQAETALQALRGSG